MDNIKNPAQLESYERLVLSQGKILSNTVKALGQIDRLERAEFQIFSQFQDDGIIQYIISRIENIPPTFIEFGVENYLESNTRFLMMNDNWSGLIMDGSRANIDQITTSYYYWKHELVAHHAIVTRENIENLLLLRPFAEVGLLHIDIDGNDYWVWEAITSIRPAIAIMEYNSVFGTERAITIPYAADFQRAKAHYSHLYFGASLPAFAHLAERKGYAFIGCNSAGNNAYFVRTDLVGDSLRRVSIQQGYRRSKFRESRDQKGRFTHLMGEERLKIMSGMPVINVLTGKTEHI